MLILFLLNKKVVIKMHSSSAAHLYPQEKSIHPIPILRKRTYGEAFLQTTNKIDALATPMAGQTLPSKQPLTFKKSKHNETIGRGSAERNLSIAHKAIAKTRAINFLSPNYLNRSGIFLGQTKDSWERYVQFAIAANTFLIHQRSQFNLDFSILPIQDDFQEHLMVGLASIISRIGQCGEMCAAVFCYLLDKVGIETKIDIVKFKDGNHCFIVLGRSMDSILSNYRTWGNAIVIDPWAMDYFPAAEMETRLKICADRGAAGKPRTLPYDPQKHHLALVNTNIYSVEELMADVKYSNCKKTAEIKFLKQWLTSFLKCTSKDERFKHAEAFIKHPLCKKIRSKHPSFYTAIEKKISNLFSQVSFYLFIWRDGNRVFPNKNHPGPSLSKLPLPSKVRS